MFSSSLFHLLELFSHLLDEAEHHLLAGGLQLLDQVHQKGSRTLCPPGYNFFLCTPGYSAVQIFVVLNHSNPSGSSLTKLGPPGSFQETFFSSSFHIVVFVIAIIMKKYDPWTHLALRWPQRILFCRESSFGGGGTFSSSSSSSFESIATIRG